MSDIASSDQLRASLRDLAPILAEYHQALLAQGFDRQEATELVVAYQTSLLNPGQASSPPQPQLPAL